LGYKVFIDGQEGTTGLKIHERVRDRRDIEILQISEDRRKDPQRSWNSTGKQM